MDNVDDLVWACSPTPAAYAETMSMLYDDPEGGSGVGRPRGKRAECGTFKAYQQHLYYGEPTDEACREANAQRKSRQQQERKDKPKRTRPAPPCGTARAYKQHIYYGEPTDPACRAANSAAVTRNDKERRSQGRFRRPKRGGAKG